MEDPDIIGTNVFGDAVSIPVELRDKDILDFGLEHALAWCWADDVVIHIHIPSEENTQ